MLIQRGENGSGWTFWGLVLPDEAAKPGCEIGIVAHDNGLQIGNDLISWADIEAARAKLTPVSEQETTDG